MQNRVVCMVSYTICITCGRLTQSQTSFCSYCHSPLPGFFRSPKLESNNGVFLGTLQDGSKFNLPQEFLGYHFSFYGVTGSGKTRLAMKLGMEAENSGMRLLVLDVEGEWRNIIPSLRGKTEYYATERNLRVNPFELGDLGLTRLLLKETIFKGVEVEYRDLSPQMNYVLDKCLFKSASIPELLDNVIYFQGEDLPFKLFNLDKTKTALLTRLEPYRTNPVLKEIFYCANSSLDLNKLDDRNMVFDLHALEAKVAYRTELRLLYNTIAVAYLRQALAREATARITHMFVADEAQMLVPKILRKLVVTDTWATTEFATRLRKRGESLTIISQSPSNIEDDIRRNAQNQFTFRLQDPQDIQLIAGSLGYTLNEAVDYISHLIVNLKQREAIVKTPFAEEPFIVEAPEVTVRGISNEELRRYVPKVKTGFNEDEQTFLEHINRLPFMPMNKRRKILEWDEKKYSEIVNRLVGNGVIEKVKVAHGKGRPVVLYQIKGRRPGVKHDYFVYWIVDELINKGLVCRIAKIGEAKPDVQIPSLKTAINIELGKSEIKKNIENALKEFERVIVCSDNEKLIKSLSEGNGDNRVLFSDIWSIPSLI